MAAFPHSLRGAFVAVQAMVNKKQRASQQGARDKRAPGIILFRLASRFPGKQNTWDSAFIVSLWGYVITSTVPHQLCCHIHCLEHSNWVWQMVQSREAMAAPWPGSCDHTHSHPTTPTSFLSFCGPRRHSPSYPDSHG